MLSKRFPRHPYKATGPKKRKNSKTQKRAKGPRAPRNPKTQKAQRDHAVPFSNFRVFEFSWRLSVFEFVRCKWAITKQKKVCMNDRTTKRISYLFGTCMI